MATGRVAWFDPAKGYGFITPDEGGGDLFVYRTALLKAGLATLEPGQRVEFSEAPGKKGPEAVDVAPL